MLVCINWNYSNKSTMNRIDSLFSELIHRVKDESLVNADVSAYATRINAVVRSSTRLNNPRLRELLQALRDVSIALHQCDERNRSELNTSPSRLYTGACFTGILYHFYAHLILQGNVANLH